MKTYSNRSQDHSFVWTQTMMIMTTTTNLQENTVKNYCIRVTCQISLHLPLNYFPCSIVFFIIVFVVFVRSLARCPHYRFASIQFTVSLASRVSPPLFYRHLATRITNVSHKILKFNKFSIINFNVIRLLHFLFLVSCFGSFVETRFCGVCVFFPFPLFCVFVSHLISNRVRYRI